MRFFFHTHKLMRPIALRKSSSNIPNKEIITPDSIIGFEKIHPVQVF